MPSNLEAYRQNYRNAKSKSIRLPALSYDPHLKDKVLINQKPYDLKKQQPKDTHLTYSKNKNSPNPVRLLHNARRVATEQTEQQFKNLSKIQQNILMQLKDIDLCLQSQRNHQNQKLKTALFSGYIFLNQINEFVVEKFHDCLQIQSQASHAIVDGFQVLKLVTGIDGEHNIVDANIVKKVSSINNKLLDKSIKAIKEYDQQKINQYEKNYGKQWSIFKKNLSIIYDNPQTKFQKSLLYQNQNDSKLTFIKSYKSRTNNESKSTNLFDSKIASNSLNSKISFINDVSFMKRSRDTKFSGKASTSIKTEPVENQQNQQKITVKLTKKDVRSMLTKHKNIVSIWIPPASYPQLFGIFSYKIVKVQIQNKVPTQFQYRCKINRYFFYKFGLNNKVFNAVLEWISYEKNLPIESLEITMEKTLYSRVFSRIGWVLKFWESSTKIKACYYGPNKGQVTTSKI